MKIGFPVSIILMLFIWWFLTKYAFKLKTGFQRKEIKRFCLKWVKLIMKKKDFNSIHFNNFVLDI